MHLSSAFRHFSLFWTGGQDLDGSILFMSLLLYLSVLFPTHDRHTLCMLLVPSLAPSVPARLMVIQFFSCFVCLDVSPLPFPTLPTPTFALFLSFCLLPSLPHLPFCMPCHALHACSAFYVGGRGRGTGLRRGVVMMDGPDGSADGPQADGRTVLAEGTAAAGVLFGPGTVGAEPSPPSLQATTAETLVRHKTWTAA